MTLYIENPKCTIRKLLEVMSEFSKVAGYKINTQKLLAFLYTNNEKSEREIKESIPFTIATKIIKYLGINLTKETKEVYTENYKTLMQYWLGLIPESGRSPGEGNGNPLQYSCLENPRDGGAWWAAVSGVAQSQT